MVEHPLVEHRLVEHYLVEHCLVEHCLVEHRLVEHYLLEHCLVEHYLVEHYLAPFESSPAWGYVYIWQAGRDASRWEGRRKKRFDVQKVKCTLHLSTLQHHSDSGKVQVQKRRVKFSKERIVGHSPPSWLTYAPVRVSAGGGGVRPELVVGRRGTREARTGDSPG
ncbi:hypothetical protein NHX12_008625 [Muraenolepis orangiensis]|uniref:Uncharacterized protein n=1 Tax=Muraenolepis orangiensis TaxID=630683 RepID=A0A9Q0DLT4_9TELE|nr:hypothetical protein NHX12_008625 [Muraenolepis orangiensis]